MLPSDIGRAFRQLGRHGSDLRSARRGTLADSASVPVGARKGPECWGLARGRDRACGNRSTTHGARLSCWCKRRESAYRVVVRAPAKIGLIMAGVANVVLILAGVHFAPGTLGSMQGFGIFLADIGLQVALVSVGLLGPGSLGRLGYGARYCLAVGVAFALAYDGLLLLEFVGSPVSLNPIVLFVIGAVVASCIVGYRTRRLTQGMLAGAWSLVLGTAVWSAGLMLIVYAFWGTRGEYLFWLDDGAIADFRHSGAHSLSVFLLQDMQGALFFHPFLSLAVGLLSGTAGAGIGLVAAALRHRAVVPDSA